MRLRFTLTHDIEGSKVISEPDGWKDSTIGFERHPDFHSLVEYFKSSFMAYGTNGVDDGGRDWVLNIEKTYGEDEEIELLVEIDPIDTNEFETLYTGQIAVNLITESLEDSHLLQIVFTQKSFWTKFISRFQNKVDIKKTTSESGETVTPANEIDLPLPSQVIDKTFSGRMLKGGDLLNIFDDYYLLDGTYSQIEFEDIPLDEILGRNTLSTSINLSKPAAFLSVIEDGEYTIDSKIEVSDAKFLPGVSAPQNPELYYAGRFHDVNLYIQKNNEPEIAFSRANYTVSVYESTVFSITQVLNLKKGDEVRLYAKYITNFSPCIGANPQQKWVYWGQNNLSIKFYLKDILSPFQYDCSSPNYYNLDLNSVTPSGNSNPTYISIIAKTTAPDTTTKAFLTHDVMSAVTDRITDQSGLFYSEYVGNAYTSRVYGSEGCGSLLANAKGLHIRGYDLTAKPFFMSGKEWWDGINPIHNLGLGYEKLAGVDVIRCERKEYFYDDSATSVLLSNVWNIKRSNDQDHQFNQIEIGYEKWQSQAATGTGAPSGIDDPQTKRTYNSRFKKVGKKLTIFSKWVAASLTLETTRRVGNLKSANYTYDDETFVIALKSNGDGTFTPELDENFTTLTNLSNADTRYNSRLTPARSLLRWLNYVSGCLQSYLSSAFKFSSGEGNFDMTSQMSTSCLGDSTLVNEKGDISVGTDFLFRPKLYEIEHYLTWEQYVAIRDNKNLAIGVSQTDTDHKKMFIKTLDYKIATGQMRAKLWAKESFGY